jgi:hypothetical protein
LGGEQRLGVQLGEVALQGARSPDAQPSWARRMRRTWAAVRAGFSRFSAIAISMTSAGTRSPAWRGVGSNASNPPRRQARIQRSRMSRETRTGRPSRSRWVRTALRGQTVGEHMPTYSPISDEPVPSVTRLAAEDAYRRAGLGPEDIDVIELQDTDSGTEIISTEELGLCEPGGGGPLVESCATRLGGRLPINPSGGLLSKGEPVGASRLGQVHEIVQQLRRLGPCTTKLPKSSLDQRSPDDIVVKLAHRMLGPRR